MPTFEPVRSQALADGFDEVIERVWKPRAVLRHLGPGDTFALEREVPHGERYGEAGAMYWVARRNREP